MKIKPAHITEHDVLITIENIEDLATNKDIPPRIREVLRLLLLGRTSYNILPLEHTDTNKLMNTSLFFARLSKTSCLEHILQEYNDKDDTSHTKLPYNKTHAQLRQSMLALASVEPRLLRHSLNKGTSFFRASNGRAIKDFFEYPVLNRAPIDFHIINKKDTHFSKFEVEVYRKGVLTPIEVPVDEFHDDIVQPCTHDEYTERIHGELDYFDLNVLINADWSKFMPPIRAGRPAKPSPFAKPKKQHVSNNDIKRQLDRIESKIDQLLNNQIK